MSQLIGLALNFTTSLVTLVLAYAEQLYPFVVLRLVQEGVETAVNNNSQSWNRVSKQGHISILF